MNATKIQGTFWNLNKSKKHTFTTLTSATSEICRIVENDKCIDIEVYTVVIGPRLLTLRAN